MKNKLKAGEILHLKIKELSLKAQGVATVDGESIFIQGGLPGDEIQAKLTRLRPGSLEAELLKLEHSSSCRVLPRCQHFGPCGGCSLQHLAYPAQVEWKRNAFAEVLKREVGLKVVPPMEVVAMEDPWAYRNKMEFSFGQEDHRVTLGLHRRGSFQQVVDILRCHIAPEPISQLLLAIKETVNRFPLKAYNPKIHQGFWRYAVIRSSLSKNQIMLLVVTNEGPQEPIEALKKELPARVPTLKSFYWGVSTKVSDVALPERLSLMVGSDVLEDEIEGIRFQIRPTNFVQPNLVLAKEIYERIRRSASLTGREAVYDLYCGIGLIALSLAAQAKVVYGVESDPENISCAERSAALNEISNAIFLCGKVEDLLKGRTLFKAGEKPDLIVVDPPRAGLHKEVYAPLLEAGAPLLMYISCNPGSLAQDLKILLERDRRYQVAEVQLFDFFPHTTHVEILVTLKR